jgi:nucleoside-diphosphate-sugar epimerase
MNALIEANMQPVVLLTGGTGFLGSYILERLVRSGRVVRALKRQTSPMGLVADLPVQWVEGDINDLGALEDAFEGVTHVIHSAAMVSFHPKDARQMSQINVDGTANVVNMCLDKGVRHLIHVSSIAALGRSKDRLVLDEASKWVDSPDNTRYAISKYRAEQEVWRGDAEGLPIAIVNPSVILGGGFWHTGTSRLFQQVDGGLPFYSSGRSGFVDVRDVADFVMLLLDSGMTGERFVLSAENWTFESLFSNIAAALDAPKPYVRVTPWIAEVAWRVEWLKEQLLRTEPVVTRESARASLNQYTYENSKSLSIPGFAYRPLDQTILETAKAYTTSKINRLPAYRLKP